MSYFVVTAIRSANSVSGEASAPVRQDGQVVKFDTFAEAQAAAADWQAHTASPNVRYVADPTPSW